MEQIVILLAVLAVSSAAPTTSTPFVWSDCTKDRNTQAIEVVSLQASPVPLIYPGKLQLDIGAVIKKTIHPGTIFQLEFKKHTSLGDVIVPCIGNFGSCALDTCALLGMAVNSTDSAISTIGSQTQNMFVTTGVKIDCPIQPQNINIPDFTIDIPDLLHSAVLAAVGDGDYQVTIQTKNAGSGEELGCVEFNAGLKRNPSLQHGHFLFG